MIRVLLVDDEPLVLIGMQSMLDWNALGYELVGTARNGADALERIGEQRPDIVVSDIRMPVLDGLQLAAQSRERYGTLPVFIMLTSYEEFDYVRRSMGLGAVDYLVKIDLTPENLTTALDRARTAIEKERVLRAPSRTMTGSLEAYRDRFFIQLYSGMFPSDDVIRKNAMELGVTLDAPAYTVAIADIRNRELSPEQQVALSSGVTRMAADILPKYLPCHVTGMDLRHFLVLLPLQSRDGLEELLNPVLKKANDILYKYFSTVLWWAVGTPTGTLHHIPRSQKAAFSALPLLSERSPIVYCRAEARTPLDHRARIVAEVQDYIRKNPDKKLSLNDVAAVFNFSPGYLSQLFTQNGETSFVEFVTETRISAAKDLMASTDLKIYEISERLGFESAFYFSKVFKKIEGMSPRAYLQKLRGVPDSKEETNDVD
ncbi:MAG: response regulator [Gemmiger sp.]|uniref:response regulator n=1 Tax=Gemmiger sp. TaxID=2049027 RepID=UPI002E792714|nr:response regulator [Gemmiger sp.]MEE0800637.1 response regulator [Gemmiger sp.]